MTDPDEGAAMSDGDEKYWYNLSTGEVEFGMLSAAVDRVGPFDTADEAALAPEKLRERSRAWAEDDAAEDSWGRSSLSDPGDDE
ncbi:SPOR domain-containing protein [Microbacterium sp. ARD32]|uniref:SPOR domain-containing protein n=1 Tax=Microbacterium sp. ARD32 TaxID=2962577 RepID=UPI0028816433|nr:SPOR domain-containing protein [Microbacterium sp. ARD32]MDT0157303.1 SPOR domain-containing protein [Microbacterium sp. ARD32]